MGTNRGVLVSAAAVGAVLALSLSGCAPANRAADTLRAGLSDEVAAAQDVLWSARQPILVDLDAALVAPLSPLSSTVTDARTLPDDPPPDTRINRWLLLDAVTVGQGTQITLAAEESTPVSSGWWDDGSNEVGAYTCFTVIVALTSLETSPSDCGEAGERAARLLSVSTEDEFVSLDEVAFHPHIDALDHPCQCYSGSPCECPGG